MEAFFLSTALVALAEMGDKTQLLALVLVARFRRPWPIVLGILAATLLNHALAGLVGARVGQWLTPEVLRWVLGLSFLAMAAWTLVPDKLDEDDTDTLKRVSRRSVFMATTIAFFLAEMGDKTQIATVALAARFDAYFWVVAGTTLGMLLANAPVVWLGEKLLRHVPLKTVRIATALLFAALGAAALLGLGG
jgi:putative Ca2+/H+ antiporter (TMEM165/GDT1 family)